MVARIVGPRQRELTRGFLQLESHYLFDHHFCRVIMSSAMAATMAPAYAIKSPGWATG
jgi:hypothetical protein